MWRAVLTINAKEKTHVAVSTATTMLTPAATSGTVSRQLRIRIQRIQRRRFHEFFISAKNNVSQISSVAVVIPVITVIKEMIKHLHVLSVRRQRLTKKNPNITVGSNANIQGVEKTYSRG